MASGEIMASSLLREGRILGLADYPLSMDEWVEMSIETAIEKYPVSKTFKGEVKTELRPLQHQDEIALGDFFLAIPEHERLFIKGRINDRTLFKNWCSDIDPESFFSLLVFHEGKIIAEGLLHQRQGGWKSHIGLIRLLVHPEFRDIGISEALIEELVEAAQHAGLLRLEMEINGEREIAIRSFTAMGFNELARIPGYVQDMKSGFHDYVLLGRSIRTDEEYAGLG